MPERSVRNLVCAVLGDMGAVRRIAGFATCRHMICDILTSTVASTRQYVVYLSPHRVQIVDKILLNECVSDSYSLYSVFDVSWCFGRELVELVSSEAMEPNLDVDIVNTTIQVCHSQLGRCDTLCRSIAALARPTPKPCHACALRSLQWLETWTLVIWTPNVR